MIESILIEEEHLSHCRDVLQGLLAFHRDDVPEALLGAVMKDAGDNFRSLPRHNQIGTETYQLAAIGQVGNDVKFRLDLRKKSYEFKGLALADLAGICVLLDRWTREEHHPFSGELRATLSSILRVLDQRCPVIMYPPGRTAVTLKSPGREDKEIHVGTASLVFMALGIRVTHAEQLERWAAETMFSPAVQFVPENVLAIFPRNGAPW